VPLVLNFHGATSSAAVQEAYSAFSAQADQPDGAFVVAYLQGITTPDRNFTHYNHTQLASPEPDDVAVISQLLNSLESQLCIDANRIYSTGMSNGAMVSVRLACSMSDRIAAIGLVAGAYYPQMALDLNPAETCLDTTPVPAIALHGTSDTFVPFAGGPGGIPGLWSSTFRLPLDNATVDEDVMESWATHNGCTGTRGEEAPLAGTTEIRLVTYDNCADNAVVRLYIVDGGGHTWPGAVDVPQLGYTTHQINATDLIWDFFRAHSLNGSPSADIDGDTAADVYDSDNDNDGCPDTSEQQTSGGSQTSGGLRNPKNPHDYFNPSGDGQNRVDDILLIVQAYFMDDDDGNPGLPPYEPGYDPGKDRTYVGPLAWNLGPPNGLQRVDDILNSVKQYFHDCS